MAKFRYYIDNGSSFNLVDIYDNKLKLDVGKKISLAIKSNEIQGSFSLIGSVAETVYNNRDVKYYWRFLVEEWNGSSWNTLHDCHVDIRGEYLQKSKTLTLNKFEERDTDASTIQAAYDNGLKTNDLGFSRNAINETYTATQQDILGVATALDKDAYQLAFDVEGNAITTPDTRWTYFTWQSTIGITPSLQHIYSTRKFDSRPVKDGTTNGYVEIIFFDVYIWVKAPPQPYTGESWGDLFLGEAYRIDNVLDAIVEGIDGGLEFDNTDFGTTNFDSTNTYIGDGNEWAQKNIQGIPFTLKKLFDFWKAFYNIHWYVDGGKLKFRDNAYKFFSDTLDWSSDSVDTDAINIINGTIPDTEKWAFGDSSLDRYLLSYFDKGILTSKNELDYSTDIVYDFAVLKQGNDSGNKLIWITLSGGSAFTETPKELFELYSKDRVFSEYAPFEVPVDPADAYNALSSHETQPIYVISLEKWIDDYSAFDLFSKITLSGGNVGYLNNYTIDLATGIGTFNIYFDTLTI
jgi:hypothetical protein